MVLIIALKKLNLNLLKQSNNRCEKQKSHIMLICGNMYIRLCELLVPLLLSDSQKFKLTRITEIRVIHVVINRSK